MNVDPQIYDDWFIRHSIWLGSKGFGAVLILIVIGIHFVLCNVLVSILNIYNLYILAYLLSALQYRSQMFNITSNLEIFHSKQIRLVLSV